MSEPLGIVLLVNGRAHRWRGISLEEGPARLPVWLVDVDGKQASAGTLESALLLAARAANAAPRGEDT